MTLATVAPAISLQKTDKRLSIATYYPYSTLPVTDQTGTFALPMRQRAIAQISQDRETAFSAAVRLVIGSTQHASMTT